MKLPQPYRECGCRDPETGRRLRRNCPKLGMVKGHGAWYVRIRVLEEAGVTPASYRTIERRLQVAG